MILAKLGQHVLVDLKPPCNAICSYQSTYNISRRSWKVHFTFTEISGSCPRVRASVPSTAGGLQPAAKTLSSARSLAPSRLSLPSTPPAAVASASSPGIRSRLPCSAVQPWPGEEVGGKGGRAAAAPWKIWRGGHGGSRLGLGISGAGGLALVCAMALSMSSAICAQKCAPASAIAYVQ